MYKYVLSILLILSVSCNNRIQQEQLSHDNSKNFDLDGRHNFSPDDQWLVYDTRPAKGGIAACKTIEKINVVTGEIKVIYRTKNPHSYGPGVGAASYNPVENEVIFIHGLQNCSAERPYEHWRRTGVIIDESHPDVPIFMDARDVTPPFTPGALRGGTHDHEWSGDGEWIAFTYNDAIMHALQEKTGEPWDLRTIGVSKPIGQVKVDHHPDGENIDGLWFSVLVVRVVPHPVPGSDEISHAAGDCWIGTRGYQKPGGKMQRARAFLGTVRNQKGAPVDEIFVVDIPEEINKPGNDGPLEGTATTFPMPPKGTVQRRLTFTAETKYPGCLGTLRCSRDGNRIAYRKRDKNGVFQIFFISPLGRDSVQVTHHESNVQSDVRWSPDGKFIYYVWDNSIIKCNVQPGDGFGDFIRMTAKSPKPPINVVLSHNGKIIAFNREVKSQDGKEVVKQIYKLAVK
ncbi:MAG: DUF3748 domain-containing protein [Actinobacteria bacterium]|nr:DUF3748 domain-containing protein [Actinomycetota bacterium]